MGVGYIMKLDPISKGDFFVKAKVHHKKSELAFEEKDIFHVTDTKPSGMWPLNKEQPLYKGLDTSYVSYRSD